MKARDQVRDETARAFRVVGYGLLTLGFGGLGIYVAAPIVASVELPGAYVAITAVMVGVGIAMAFPRSAIGHVLAAHFDALLDRLVGPDGES